MRLESMEASGPCLHFSFHHILQSDELILTDLGIIATTIGHESFLTYMFPPAGKNAPVLGLRSHSFSTEFILT
jgi:hypothetical protein